MRLIEMVVALYPRDVRDAYGAEIAADLSAPWTRPVTARSATIATWDLLAVVVDAGFERISSLYSHRSFHGRCTPDPGVVRPPNMSKAEWFGAAQASSSDR
jgi:hypothetical protein